MRLRIGPTMTLFGSVVALSFAQACSDATQVRLEIRTDLPCERNQGVSIAVAQAGAAEDRAPQVVTHECSEGFIGTLVLRPTSPDKRVAIKVTQGIDRDVTLCTAQDGYEQCSVQRREFFFVEGERRILPIVLKGACVGTPCADHATCAAPSSCVDSLAQQCADDGRCVPPGIDSTPPGTSDASTDAASPRVDAAVDAGPVGYRKLALGVGVASTAMYFPSSGHSCALTHSGELGCWGNNDKGQLGLDSTIAYGSLLSHMVPAVALGGRVADVSAGELFTCAALEDGRVKCWGAGTKNGTGFGELGLGNIDDHGMLGGDMAALPFVLLGAGVRARGVAAGETFACALVDHTLPEGGTHVGRVKCWGNNSSGQLGAGDVVHRGRNTGEMGDQLPFVDLGSGPGKRARKLALGLFYSCALLEDETLKCWGNGSFGQLGYDNTSRIGDEPGEMGALASVSLGGAVTDVCTGLVHTCAVLDGSRVKCWGWNGQGTLGLGDTLPRGDSPARPVLPPPAVNLGSKPGDTAIHVACGGTHTCAELANGRIKCWGFNTKGQLGIGETLVRGTLPTHMGDELKYVRVLSF